MESTFKKILKANYQQILFVFLAFFAMVLVSYVYTSTIVRNQMLALGEETMNTTQTAVSGSLAETELIFFNTTQAVETMLASEKTNAEILAYLSETNDYYLNDRSPLPDFLKVYGYIRGEFLDGSGWVPPEDYYPPSRPWHIGAAGNDGKIFFSEPYIDADTGGMCISFSQELFDPDGVSHGILAIDLNLSRITDYVAQQQIANNGYGVLLSDTLQFTTHRDSALIGLPMAEAGGDYTRLAELIATGQPVSAERFTDVDGTDSIAYFRTIFNGWHIGVITPRASYYAQVYTLGRVLSVLGFVFMTALCIILVRTRVEKMRSDEESQSKSTFLARMSHEMRTPMNAIIGMTQIARQTDDPEKISASLEKIGGAADHLLGVINDILDMSKIEAGKLELSETNFLFKKMLDQVFTVTNYRIEEKHQHFTIHIDNSVPAAIIADRQRLAQIITNLLSNANKFTPEGGVIDLSVRAENKSGAFCTLRIEVADNGIGLSPEQQARLFHSFEQADNSISRKYGGTGLGLAISKKIIDQMQGEAWIDSQLGQGATFGFTVPVTIGDEEQAALEEATEAEAEPQVQSYAGHFAGKRILLAEDIEINREILITLLEETGVAIDSAENGLLACEAFKADPTAYDMIFMDIHMPEMDGYEATRCIRASGALGAKTIPIIAMTANVFREDIEKCLDAGMDDHVGKPIELDDVLQKMQRYMG
ncbi:MAG: ATP-binding protein [Oscillospiraceae bacterium]